jgi:hypothetical protein
MSDGMVSMMPNGLCPNHLSKRHFDSDVLTWCQGLQGIPSFLSNEVSCSCLFHWVEIPKDQLTCHSMLSGQPFRPNNNYAWGHLGVSDQ